jgi:single-strand DNA-binding protein
MEANMTNGLNRVTLYGNLGADPDLRTTGTGIAVLSFRIATTNVYFDKNQEKQERTEWHHVVLFGARAEPLSKLLTKGARVLVEGRLQTSSYEKDGIKRYRTEIIATEICLAGARHSNGAPARASASRELDDVPF